MKRTNTLTVALLVASLTTVAAAQTTAQAKKGERPKDSPGWVVLEENWFFPFRYESADALHRARVHYRQHEEQAAAYDLRKAESWLRLAAGHAMPITKQSLENAAADLAKLANDVEQKKLQSATGLDQAMAKADRAMAEWHYFNAKNHLAIHEEKWAAEDLRAAAHHLQSAASSARYEYGADTVTLFDAIDENGKMVDEGLAINPNQLSDHLTAIEREIQKMSDVLNKPVAVN